MPRSPASTDYGGIPASAWLRKFADNSLNKQFPLLALEATEHRQGLAKAQNDATIALKSPVFAKRDGPFTVHNGLHSAQIEHPS